MHNHLLGECGIIFVSTAKLMRQYKRHFPRSLDGAPMLLPTDNTSIRRALEQWFQSQGIRPKVVAEFEDYSLLRAFGEFGEKLKTAYLYRIVDEGCIVLLREFRTRAEMMQVDFTDILQQSRLQGERQSPTWSLNRSSSAVRRASWTSSLSLSTIIPGWTTEPLKADGAIVRSIASSSVGVAEPTSAMIVSTLLLAQGHFRRATERVKSLLKS